jgi:hypothetical protein
MIAIPEVAEFTIGEDGIQFTTKTNGDTIRMTGLQLSAENAAALARLINFGVELKVEIIEK